MKLSRENKFSGAINSVKKSVSEFSFKTCLGKIKNYFMTPFSELFEDDFEDEFEDDFLDDEEENNDYSLYVANGNIYHFVANSVEEYKFVKNILANGYTAIIALDALSKEDSNLFIKNLRLDLFRFGIRCISLSEKCLIVAQKNVEIVNFEDEPVQKGKVLSLDEYRQKKY